MREKFCTYARVRNIRNKVIEVFKSQIETCHIYIIGTLPAVEIVDWRLDAERLFIRMLVAGKRHELDWPLSDGAELVETEDGWFVKSNDSYWAPTKRSSFVG